MFGRRHVTPLATAFLDAHPETAVELRLSDRYLDLIDEQLDVAVRIGALADSSLVARKVGEVRRVLVAAPAYLARAGAPLTPADVASHRTVLTSDRPQGAEWRFRRADGRELAVRIAPRLSVSDVDATLAAARDGHGLAWALSYQVAPDLADGRLVRLLAEYELAPLPVQLVTPSLRLAPARVRAFVDHAAATLASLPVLRPR